jgi:hypothetical protein
MNYYILPKNNINPNINLLFTEKSLLKPYSSKSAVYFLNNISNQLTNMNKNPDSDQDQDQDLNENTVEYSISLISKLVNTYEFIFSNVPGYSLSVSKVKPESNIFFELLELFHVCNITENFKKQKMINLHVSPNANSSIYFLNILREDYNDINLNENIILLYDKFIRNRNNVYPIKYDFLYFECNKNDYLDIDNYTNYMIFYFYIILKYQNNDGISIIKINNLIHKSIIDIVYLLTNIFEKVMIIKPSVTNIISGERFIVCKKFINNHNFLSKVNLEETLYKIILNINNYNYKEKNLFIESIIDNEISYLFMNKIEEFNVVISQQQLEAIDQIINIVKNKNKDDKIEILKRNHIQKCIQWCEKYKIPHNKFMEKLNIFLNNNVKNSEKTVVCDCEIDYEPELT